MVDGMPNQPGVRKRTASSRKNWQTAWKQIAFHMV